MAAVESGNKELVEIIIDYVTDKCDIYPQEKVSKHLIAIFSDHVYEH